MQVKVNGVDVFHPNSGEVRSDGPDGIACWFIDTDYNEESFFVRHAYFLGQNDPYKALKTTLKTTLKAEIKAEINEEAWETLQRHLAPLRQAGVGPDRGEGHQPPRRRSDEGVPSRLMEIRIAETFTASLARLTADEQRAAKTTALAARLRLALPQPRQPAPAVRPGGSPCPIR